MSSTSLKDAALVAATPVLASLDIRKTVDFYTSKLGFTEIYAAANEYAVTLRDRIELHFWYCTDPGIPKMTSCRIEVDGIDALYEKCQREGVVHPNAPLHETPWGTREFSILDEDGNCIAFHQRQGGR
tara:strand:+ start:1227 stop:1610 length:384 start_codon:yes stop_codon:yes gene_type:complete